MKSVRQQVWFQVMVGLRRQGADLKEVPLFDQVRRQVWDVKDQVWNQMWDQMWDPMCERVGGNFL